MPVELTDGDESASRPSAAQAQMTSSAAGVAVDVLPAAVPRQDAPPDTRPVERWLSATPTAPSVARRQVAATLDEWGLTALAEECRLVVSELVANAVTASTRPGLDPNDRFLRFLGLRLTDTGRRLFIEVFDAAPGLPTLRPNNPLTEGGRGLHLVAALATWGVYAATSGAGKVVWAAFEHEEPRSARASVLGALPRRSPATSDAPPTVDKDLALLGRVREGLRALTFTGEGPR